MPVDRVRAWYNQFPRQVWVLFFGSIISAMGAGLIFPFLSLYLRQKLGVPMTTIGLVLGARSMAAVPAQLIGGELADRWGRRKLMAFSLLAMGLTNIGFGLAGSLPQFVVLAILGGTVGTLFAPASNAMLADLVGKKDHARAYALLRVASNLGFSIGPAMGGFLAMRSYLAVFLIGALGNLTFGSIVLAATQETKPDFKPTSDGARTAPRGFSEVFRNRRFMAFAAITVSLTLLFSQMSTLLPVHMKESFGLQESYFGWVMTLSSFLITCFQFSVSQWAGASPGCR